LRADLAEHEAYTSTEEFLWSMEYAGDVATMSADFITGFYRNHERKDWFQRESREEYTKRYFKISDISLLDDFLNRNRISIATVKQLVCQIRWLEKYLPQFPDSGTSYLELGYGKIPVISYFLCSKFSSAIAIDPCNEDSCDYPDIGELAVLIKSLFPGLKSVEPAQDTKRISTSNKALEDLQISAESIDFCSSRTVFEHIEDVESVSQELFRILKPGGAMLHEIGLYDHTGGAGSGIHFDFLKYSRKEWTDPWRGTNHYRLSDYVNLWESLGFRVEVIGKVVTPNIPTAIDTSWFSYPLEDLLCQTAVVKATKPLS
jgi:hypothetical protein